MALETSWKVIASDISMAALEVAKRNAELLNTDLEFHHGSLMEPVPGNPGLVVSNPPYLDPADRDNLQRELSFEPEAALFAPDRGLALGTELLRQAWRRKVRACVLEIGAGQGQELSERAQVLGWGRIEVRKDWAEHERVLVVIA
jgi:release factor glutamine methyltransferase